MEWLDATVNQVMNQLEQKQPENPRDIYVWSDGSVTGPKENESEVSDLRVVSVFTPGETLSEADIRQSIENGLATAP